MNKALITSDGLDALARIFVSCKPIMAEIMKANQLYLIAKSKAGKDVDYESFVGNLPLPDPTYQQIMDYALSIGEVSITAKVAQLFFGGEPHFKKILGQVNDPKNRLKEDFAKRIFFAHILMPVLIESVEPLCAVYKNGEIMVKIRNLVATNKDALKVGSTILVHYASVISHQPDAEVVSELLRVQAQSPEFIGACEYVQAIDYDNFWNLSKWTEEIIKDRNL